MAKKHFVTTFFIGLLLGIGTLPQNGQSQTLNEFVAVDSLQVGDTFDFAITLDRDREYDDISYPDSSHFGPAFEIRSKEQFKLSEYKDSVHYELQFFGTADTLIPKLPVHIALNQDTTSLYTKPVPIAFSSTISEEEDSFRPLKPIFEFARTWWPYLLVLLLLAAAGYYGYRHYQRWLEEQKEPEERPEFTPSPFVNPLKKYKKSIKQLENAQLKTQEDYKEFYSDLGDAIRQYYESLYNLPALESTSRELLIMLKNGAIDEDLISDTRAVLQEADMVKFAKFNPTQKQADRALQKANNFLKRARKVDGPRIDHMRRKHQAKMEAQRKEFYEEHPKSEGEKI